MSNQNADSDGGSSGSKLSDYDQPMGQYNARFLTDTPQLPDPNSLYMNGQLYVSVPIRGNTYDRPKRKRKDSSEYRCCKRFSISRSTQTPPWPPSANTSTAAAAAAPPAADQQEAPEELVLTYHKGSHRCPTCQRIIPVPNDDSNTDEEN